MRRILGLSTSVLALALCGAAHAQTSSGSSSTGASSNEVVVVTAQRRHENLQKTAISATVLNSQDLANKNVVTVDQLQFVAPSVAVDNFGQGNDFNIRGIGKGEHNSQTSTGVITYRDGVETYPGYIQEEPYFDIASIEILRGPQGTFVGSNATGGAVFVNTNDPIIGGGYDGYVMANVGNYSEYGAQGAVNIPLGDTLAVRVAFFGDERDSFYHITDTDPVDACPHNQYAGCKPGYRAGNVKWGAGRFDVLWKPTNALTVSFKYDAGYLDNGAYEADPAANATLTGPNKSDPFHISANAPQGALDRYNRAILKADYVFEDGITLQSVTGFQFSNSRYRADLDGTDGSFFFAGLPEQSFFDSVDTTLWSEEVNLISPDTGRVTWILGAFAQSLKYNFLSPMQFDINLFEPAFNPAFNYTLQGKNPETSYAGFGQVAVKVTDNVKLELGGRFSTHSTKNNVQVDQYGTPITDIQGAHYHNFSYKAALDWTLDDDNFLYGFIATGFKPGGLNVPVGFGQPAPFKSETVTSYETGWKSTLLDGHLRTDVDAYYNSYRSFQVSIGYPFLPTFPFEVNDPNPTKIYGVEAEADAVFGQLSFNLGLGLMHSSLGTFFANDPRIGFGPVCLPKTGPAAAGCTDLGGRSQAYAPNFTFNVGAQYEFSLGGGDTLTPSVNYGHMSDQWATLFEDENRGDRLQARNILGGQLAWSHGTWIAALYGTNLTDQHYIAAANSGVRWAGAPRQFGFRLTKVF